jgi:hypothetical protein
MWNQFRMEAGLQASVHWFGRGQTFEVNYSTVTNLQPSSNWRPVLGVIWISPHDPQSNQVGAERS